jgi:hypothetical protein
MRKYSDEPSAWHNFEALRRVGTFDNFYLPSADTKPSAIYLRHSHHRQRYGAARDSAAMSVLRRSDPQPGEVQNFMTQ